MPLKVQRLAWLLWIVDRMQEMAASDYWWIVGFATDESLDACIYQGRLSKEGYNITLKRHPAHIARFSISKLGLFFFCGTMHWSSRRAEISSIVNVAATALYVDNSNIVGCVWQALYNVLDAALRQEMGTACLPPTGTGAGKNREGV